MNSDDVGFFMGAFFGLIVGAFFAAMFMAAKIDVFRAQAVSLNAAEWVVNPKNGETTFTWKENK